MVMAGPGLLLFIIMNGNKTMYLAFEMMCGLPATWRHYGKLVIALKYIFSIALHHIVVGVVLWVSAAFQRVPGKSWK